MLLDGGPVYNFLYIESGGTGDGMPPPPLPPPAEPPDDVESDGGKLHSTAEILPTTSEPLPAGVKMNKKEFLVSR